MTAPTMSDRDDATTWLPRSCETIPAPATYAVSAPTLADRVDIYAAHSVATPDQREAIERFVIARVPARDAGRIAQATKEPQEM